MKTLLNAIYEIFESFGQARAAAYLARHGMLDEAKALMTK